MQVCLLLVATCRLGAADGSGPSQRPREELELDFQEGLICGSNILSCLVLS
eukprot:COSAG06_NODE_1346_length_9780_cov_44.066729_2_plen_51_part_00